MVPGSKQACSQSWPRRLKCGFRSSSYGHVALVGASARRGHARKMVTPLEAHNASPEHAGME